jgi:hypothetical protein
MGRKAKYQTLSAKLLAKASRNARFNDTQAYVTTEYTPYTYTNH